MADRKEPTPADITEIERRAFNAGVRLQPWVEGERGNERNVYIFDGGDKRKFNSIEEAFIHWRHRR